MCFQLSQLMFFHAAKRPFGKIPAVTALRFGIRLPETLARAGELGACHLFAERKGAWEICSRLAMHGGISANGLFRGCYGSRNAVQPFDTGSLGSETTHTFLFCSPSFTVLQRHFPKEYKFRRVQTSQTNGNIRNAGLPRFCRL